MSILKGVLEEEIERLSDMEQAYLEKINSFPQGSIHCRAIKGNEYAYWKYKEGKFFVQKSLGVYHCDNVQELINKIEKRKQYELQLKQIRNEKKEIQKVLSKISPRSVKF